MIGSSNSPARCIRSGRLIRLRTIRPPRRSRPKSITHTNILSTLTRPMTYRLQLCYPISCYSLCRRSTVCAIFLPRPLLLRPCRHVFRIEGKKSLPFWGALNLCRRRSKRLQQIHLLIKQCKMLSSQCIYVSSVSNRWCTATNS